MYLFLCELLFLECTCMLKITFHSSVRRVWGCQSERKNVSGCTNCSSGGSSSNREKGVSLSLSNMMRSYLPTVTPLYTSDHLRHDKEAFIILFTLGSSGPFCTFEELFLLDLFNILSSYNHQFQCNFWTFCAIYFCKEEWAKEIRCKDLHNCGAQGKPTSFVLNDLLQTLSGFSYNSFVWSFLK